MDRSFNALKNYLFTSFFLFFTSPSLAAEPLVGSDVPPGFESLLGPQSNFVDVVFQGRGIGSFLVTYSPGQVAFDDPDKLAAALPNIKSATVIADALRGELNSNQGKSCTPVVAPGCDTLEVPIAGVIFDPDAFRLVVIVNRDQLPVQDVNLVKYYPDPDAGLSLIQYMSFSGTANKSDTSTTTSTYSLSGTSLIGYEDMRARIESVYDDDTGLYLDEVFADKDDEEWMYGGGLFRSRGSSLISDSQIYGVVAANTLRTRADREQLLSNELVVFLERDSQVEILRDGRLLTVDRYSAGNQVIDTRRLPYGTYEITIRTRDNTGAITEENRLFIKDNDAPPIGEKFYSFNAGVITEGRSETNLMPKTSNTQMVRLGMDYRPVAELAVGANAFNYGDSFGVDGSARYFLESSTLSASALATSKTNLGVNIGAQWSNQDYSVAGRVTRTEISDTTDETPIFSLSSGSSTTGDMRVGVALPENQRLNLFGRVTDAELTDRSFSYGLSYNKRLASDDEVDVDFGVNLTKTQDDQIIEFKVTVSDRGPNWNLRGNFESDQSDASGNTQRQSLSGSYTPEGIEEGKVYLTGFINNDSTNTRQFGGEAQYTTGYGSYSAGYARSSTSSGATNQNMFVRGNAGFSANADGFSWGSGARDDAGVVVVINGSSAIKAAFDVLVDGAVVYEKASVGDRILVPVSPYNDHRIAIRGVNAPSVTYDAAERQITPFPGNVLSSVWEVRASYTVFGRLLTAQGEPVGNAFIQGKEAISQTTENGYLQIEVQGDVSVQATTPDGFVCTAQITVGESEGEYIPLGDITCQ